MPVELRPDGSSRILRLVGDDLDRGNGVRLDLHDLAACLRVPVHQAKSHHQRLLQRVATLHSLLRGVVLFSPLALLHPVEDISSLRQRTIGQPLDACWCDL